MRQTDQKLMGLERQRARYDRNRIEPHLQQLFLEITPRCNLSCIHCGSRCDEHAEVAELDFACLESVLRRVREAFGRRVFVVLTGGEPLLRPDIFDLGSLIGDLGFAWGMTTNATLIDEECARRLIASGLRSVSVSLDGTPEVHDAVRRRVGSYEAAVRGIENLAATEGLAALQVTSVMNHQTIGCVDDLFEIVKDLPIDSWRLANVEPIGSALAHPEILFTPADYRFLFDYIRQKREDHWPVEYGCCHYLGLADEGNLRGWFYLCNAGIHVMGVTHTGDIVSCLDIERRPETVFGNVLTDDIAEVWEQGFGIFRTADGLADRAKTCVGCPDRRFCRGDSAHSFDYEGGFPRVCMRRDLPGFVSVAAT